MTFNIFNTVRNELKENNLLKDTLMKVVFGHQILIILRYVII